MCQAIREMREEAEARGEARGEARDEAKGLSWLADFVKSGVLTLEQVAQKTGLTESEFAAKQGLGSDFVLSVARRSNVASASRASVVFNEDVRKPLLPLRHLTARL